MKRYVDLLAIAFGVSALCWLALSDNSNEVRCLASGGLFSAKTIDGDTGFADHNGDSVDRIHVTFCVRGSANVMRVLEGSHVY